MDMLTWKDLDEELDTIERDDVAGLTDFFLRHRGAPLVVNGRLGRVNLNNFSKHIGVGRHTLESWVRVAEQHRDKESA